MSRRVKITAAFVLFLVILLPFVWLKLINRPAFPSGRAQKDVVAGNVATGETVGDILKERNVPAGQIQAITAALRRVFNPRRCNIGDTWELIQSADGGCTRFTYKFDPLEYCVVTRDEAGLYSAERKTIAAEKKLTGARGSVTGSLYESMSAAEINPELIMQFTDIFESRLDFFTDCREGDRFALVWETYVHDGRVLKNSRVAAAKYENGDGCQYAFYLPAPDGRTGAYYDEKGQALEAAFLRAPLNYRRISSFFSYRRRHPISRVFRPHLGIDYVAQKGTPVSAIGNGTVIFAGWTTNGYGNAVKIKHPNGTVSYYGHLSRVRKGLRNVQKGQIIGYVGSTGASTGPHLDFRLRRNGKFVNFLKLPPVPSGPVPSGRRAQFDQARTALLKQMSAL